MANALTVTHNAIVNCIKTPVTLINPFSGTSYNSLGLWDTGATNSAITKSTATKLGLKPITRTTVKGVHGWKDVNVYYVEVSLNNKQITINVQVSECDELSSGNDTCMLIGMDIIKLGDFSITNFEGKTIMSFICPPQKHIDYVKEINDYNRIVKIHKIWEQKGDNKCPCGSGKSFKNCHGRIQYK